MYQTFIRPILEYGSVIWDNCNNQQSDEREKIQKRAVRIVSGDIIRCSTLNLYKELGWETLEKRRQNARLNLYKELGWETLGNPYS